MGLQIAQASALWRTTGAKQSTLPRVPLCRWGERPVLSVLLKVGARDRWRPGPHGRAPRPTNRWAAAVELAIRRRASAGCV